MRDSSLMSVFLLFECFQIVFPSTAEFDFSALDEGLISIIHLWAAASVKFCLGTRLHSVVLSEYMDAPLLNLNTAFYEDALSQIQAGELLLCAGASLTRLLSHSDTLVFLCSYAPKPRFTLKSSVFSLHYDCCHCQRSQSHGFDLDLLRVWELPQYHQSDGRAATRTRDTACSNWGSSTPTQIQKEKGPAFFS